MKIEGLTYTYPGGGEPALRDVSLTIRPGECHVVTGPTGSGKSTLALALGGMLPGTTAHASDTGIVFQNPQTQLLASSVGAEAAFGLENLCVEPGEMTGMVRDALGRTGLDKPLGTNPRIMSMGEKYRLLIAAQLVMGRGLVVLDEPSGQLDGRGMSDLALLIASLKGWGVSFLVCEHNPHALSGVTDRSWRMLDGLLSSESGHVSIDNACYIDNTAAPRSCDIALAAEGLGLVHTETGFTVWDGLDFAVPAGTRAAFTGPNGAGKTSLLRCISGSLRPSSGTVRVMGNEPSPHLLRGVLGYMPQNPDAQLFEDTVLDEVSFTLKRLGVANPEAVKAAGGILERFGMSGLAGRSPHMLSYGQKRLVCLASLMAASPKILLLDSPLTGLDADRRTLMLGALDGYADNGGTAVVTSHDNSGLGGWADPEYKLAGGRAVAEVA